jgi:hypothetical protein
MPENYVKGMNDAGHVAQYRKQDVEPEVPGRPTSRNTPTGGNRIAKTILIGSAAVTAIEYHLLSGLISFSPIAAVSVARGQEPPADYRETVIRSAKHFTGPVATLLSPGAAVLIAAPFVCPMRSSNIHIEASEDC